MLGHVVYVCIHIWRQADNEYLPHSFSLYILRQVYLVIQPTLGLSSLSTSCDYKQAATATLVLTIECQHLTHRAIPSPTSGLYNLK